MSIGGAGQKLRASISQIGESGGLLAQSVASVTDSYRLTPGELSTDVQPVSTLLEVAHEQLTGILALLPAYQERLNTFLRQIGEATVSTTSFAPPDLQGARPKAVASPRATYDAIAVLGSAYNFEADRFPEHVYKTLDDAARVFQQGQAAGGIALCGAGAMKDIFEGRVSALSEAEQMKRYLVSRHVIDPKSIYLEDQSTNTIENMWYLKLIAMQQNWRKFYLPTAAGRVPRIAFLSAKICHGSCDFTVQGIPCETTFPDEPKLVGDQVCTLQKMAWGDHEFFARNGGWNKLRLGHHSCEFYVPSSEAEPFTNYHPSALMMKHSSPN